jgi:hypothetical protein
MRTLTIFFIFSFIFSSYHINAQTPNWLWAKGFGGANDESMLNSSIDANGNVYILGNFDSPFITFDNITLINAYYTGGASVLDYFLVKYDSIGNVIWAKRIGGSSSFTGRTVTVDTSGNVYVTGVFRGQNMTFGNTTLVNVDITGITSEICIFKLDTNGNFLWANSIGGNGLGTTNDLDIIASTTVDINGNLLVYGFYASPTITLGAFSLSNTFNMNLFFAKYDTNGNVLWAKSSGGGAINQSGFYPGGISSDENGNFVLTGNFEPSIEFDSISLVGSGSFNSAVFIAKFDSSGNVLWARCDPSSQGLGTAITFDKNGNIFFTGFFVSPTITFDTITLNNYDTTGIYEDFFIVKYDAYGNVIWANVAGGNSSCVGGNIATDSNGNILVAGAFFGNNLVFGGTTLASAGFYDGFFVKYDSFGNAIWAKSFGTSNADGPSGILVDSNNDIYVTGLFEGPILSLIPVSIVNSGFLSYDLFIAKLNASTVGIEELALQSSLSIAPNPFTFQTTISFKEEQTNSSLRIFDIVGKEVKSFTFSGKQLKFEKEDIKSGVYILQCVDKNKIVSTKKIVIQ